MSTNFLWYAGSSNNGLLTPAVSLQTTELESLASAAVIISSVGGSSGVFTNSNTAQAIWADLFLSIGNPGMVGTLSAGANVAGWFLTSPDSGTTFESATVAPPRPPDFIIPFPAATNPAASSFFKAAGLVRIPALEFKVLVQNNTGQAIGNGGTTVPYLKMAAVAVQY